MGAEHQRLFDVGSLRRARHETPVGEVPDFGAHDGFVHRIDQRIARDDDHQRRGAEIERLVADVLRDPHGTVLGDAERPRNDPQVYVDQLARVFDPVGIHRGERHFGQCRSDTLRIGVAAAYDLIERRCPVQPYGLAPGRPEPLGEHRRRVVEMLGFVAEVGVCVFGHSRRGDPFQYVFLAVIHLYSFFRILPRPASTGH